MSFQITGLDKQTSIVLLAAGVVFVGLLGLAMTGTVAAGAGSETGACMGRVY